MVSDFNRILSIGYSPENPDYLNTKLRVNNVVALCILGIALIYTIFSWFFYPPLTWLPAIAFPLLFGSILLSHLGAYNISRMLVAFAPYFICMIYHEGLISKGSTPIAGILLLQGAFSLLPFILFDLREKPFLFFTSSVCFIATVFFTAADGLLEYNLDDSLFRTGFLQEFTVAIGMLLFYTGLYTLAVFNAEAEKKSQELLKKGEAQKLEMIRQKEEVEKHLKTLEEAKEEEQKRAWASEGFARFGAIMRSNNDSSQLFDNLLAGLVKYVGANQAALYLVEGEGDEVQLRLQACYAYNRKKFREYSVKAGQGLVGQVYLEKEYTYLTQLPQQYTYITSGLGEATPSALLLVPLMSNEVVEGVLEIASFKPFEKHIIQFLDQLGKDIAAMISTNKINSLTRKLLHEAQEQTEEMRAQEEEMRQNMEELQATQEEMMRKENEYLARIRELENEQMEISR